MLDKNFEVLALQHQKTIVENKNKLEAVYFCHIDPYKAVSLWCTGGENGTNIPTPSISEVFLKAGDSEKAMLLAVYHRNINREEAKTVQRFPLVALEEFKTSKFPIGTNLPKGRRGRKAADRYNFFQKQQAKNK